MQDQQFDDLAKRITEPVPRRVVVRAAVVTALGGLMSMARLGEAHAQGSTTCGSNRCVDLNNDPSNCGRCGNSCGFNGVCLRGQCTCPSGYVSCTTSAGLHKCIQCASGLVASNNCTTCACPSGTTQCGSTCADLRTCDQHCGACNHACSAGQGCVNGACVCPNGQQACPNGSRTQTGSNCITCPTGQVAQSSEGCYCACPTNTYYCHGTCVENNTTVCGGTCCQNGYQCSQGHCCPPNSAYSYYYHFSTRTFSYGCECFIACYDTCCPPNNFCYGSATQHQCRVGTTGAPVRGKHYKQTTHGRSTNAERI